MAPDQKPEYLAGLERSCAPDTGERIVEAPAVPGIERIEARFAGDFFAPHRHDTYAIGVTLRGVQTFRYRRQQHYSLPGHLIVLHPDELHDGAAATEAGLCYRMLYIEPAMIHRALGEHVGSLPFVKQPVVDDAALQATLLAALGRLDEGIGDLALTDIVAGIAAGLSRHAEAVRPRLEPDAIDRVYRARDYLCDHALRTVRSDELERVTGLDRYALSRQFRKVFATSPHRFLIMRRLDHARRLIGEGHELADVAAAAGFADQSHLTRHFKKCFGITPGRWAQATLQSFAGNAQAYCASSSFAFART